MNTPGTVIDLVLKVSQGLQIQLEAVEFAGRHGALLIFHWRMGKFRASEAINELEMREPRYAVQFVCRMALERLQRQAIDEQRLNRRRPSELRAGPRW